MIPARREAATFATACWGRRMKGAWRGQPGGLAGRVGEGWTSLGGGPGYNVRNPKRRGHFRVWLRSAGIRWRARTCLRSGMDFVEV